LVVLFVLLVAGVALVVVVAPLALGDVVAFAAGVFLSFRDDCFFVMSGVALVAGVVAGCSAFVFGAVAGVFFLFDFLSDFGVAGVIAGVVAGAWFTAGSFTGGTCVFGATAGVSIFGVSVLGARVCAGFTSAGAFFSDFGFLPGDSSSPGVGCWAIAAPASASESTINRLVIFFMVALLLVVNGDDLFNPRRFPARNASHSVAGGPCPEH